MRQFVFEHSPDQLPETKHNAPSDCANTVKCVKANEEEDVITISLHKSNVKTDESVDSFIRKKPAEAIDLIEGTEHGTLVDREGKPFNVHTHIAAVALDWYTDDENCLFSRRVGEIIYEERSENES